MPFYEGGLHVIGGLESGASEDHMCRGLMGIREHVREVLQSEHRHPPSSGRGPLTGSFIYTIRYVAGILRDTGGMRHPVFWQSGWIK